LRTSAEASLEDGIVLRQVNHGKFGSALAP
jgi:hypothetical protein